MTCAPARAIEELNWFVDGFAASISEEPLSVAVSLEMSLSPSHATRPTFALTVPLAGVRKLSSGMLTDGRVAATSEVRPSYTPTCWIDLAGSL